MASALKKAAALASKARAAAEPTYNLVRGETVKRYDQLMAQNAQYVVKDKEAADKLLRQYVFTQLNKIPATIAECKSEAAVLRSKWAQLRELPSTEVATYLGFTAELYAWFCLGEIVGRGGSLTGYHV